MLRSFALFNYQQNKVKSSDIFRALPTTWSWLQRESKTSVLICSLLLPGNPFLFCQNIAWLFFFFYTVLTPTIQLKQRRVLVLQTVTRMLSFKFATRRWKSKLFRFQNAQSCWKDRVHSHVNRNIRNTNENPWAYAQLTVALRSH